MDITVNPSATKPGVQVVRLAGRLDAASSDAAGPKLTQILDGSPAGIILDMGETDFVSSAGLRVLMGLHKQAQTAGKRLALIRVHPAVYKIFKITALDQVFKCLEDEAEATQALGS